MTTTERTKRRLPRPGIVLFVALILLVGAGVLSVWWAGRSLQYIGRTNEIGDAPTPAGFSISPSEAKRINDLHRQYPKITVDDFYHDEESYYICDGFFDLWGRGRGSTASGAVRIGTVINGQTGEIYNRLRRRWEPDPRNEIESQTD